MNDSSVTMSYTQIQVNTKTERSILAEIKQVALVMLACGSIFGCQMNQAATVG